MEQPKLDRIKIEESIRQIEGLYIKTASIKYLQELLKPLFVGYQVEAPVFNPPLYLYRGRIYKKPKLLSEISYPPSCKVKSFGRVNDIHESIFYGATGRNAPFFEIDAKVGDFMALSCWKTTEDILLNHVGFTSESSNNLESSRKLQDNYSFTKDTANFDTINNLVYNYLANKYSEIVTDKDKYKLTIAITKQLMKPPFNGILYPTIAMKGNVDNVAIKTNFVDKHIQLVYVQYVIIKKIDGTKYDFDVIDSATNVTEDGELIWNGRNIKWEIAGKGEELIFKTIGSDWVAFDKRGTRIDPV